jgi:hypothetical protein
MDEWSRRQAERENLLRHSRSAAPEPQVELRVVLPTELDLTGEPTTVAATGVQWLLLDGAMDNVAAVENVDGDHEVAEAARLVRDVLGEQVRTGRPENYGWPPAATTIEVVAPAGLWRFVADKLRTAIAHDDGPDVDHVRALAETVRAAAPRRVIQVREPIVAWTPHQVLRVCFVGDSFVAGWRTPASRGSCSRSGSTTRHWWTACSGSRPRARSRLCTTVSAR